MGPHVSIPNVNDYPRISSLVSFVTPPTPAPWIILKEVTSKNPHNHNTTTTFKKFRNYSSVSSNISSKLIFP